MKRIYIRTRNEAKEKAHVREAHFLDFDLEVVCYCPSANARVLFYTRWLAMDNFHCSWH